MPRTARRSAQHSDACTSRRQPTGRGSPIAAARRGGGRPRVPFDRSSTADRISCSPRSSSSSPDSPRSGCRAARSTAISFATTCCSSATASRESSISASRRRISSRTTSRSPSTTGASSTDGADAGALVPELVDALAGAYDAVRPLDTRRARAMAGTAARGGAALLAVAALRPSSAAPRRARARARSRAFRAHPARSHRPQRAPARAAPRATPCRRPTRERARAADRLRAPSGAPRHRLAQGGCRHARGSTRALAAAAPASTTLIQLMVERRSGRRAARDDGGAAGVHRRLPRRGLDAAARRRAARSGICSADFRRISGRCSRSASCWSSERRSPSWQRRSSTAARCSTRSRRNAKPDEALRRERAGRGRDAVRHRCAHCRTLLAVWFAPALVVFQDCGARAGARHEPPRGDRELAAARGLRAAALLLRRGAARNRHRADRGHRPLRRRRRT